MPTCFRGAPSSAATVVLLVSAVLAFSLAACADGDQLVLGRTRTSVAGSAASAGSSGVGFGNAGTGAVNGLDASSPRPSSLTVQIEREAVAVEIVTVQCAGECVDVEAVARGGFPPYTYAWEDGSTDPVRRLCPRATTPFTVSATDSGLTSLEFQQKPSTAKSTVTAEVLACNDAGLRPDGGAVASDGGADGAQCARAPLASATCTTLALEPCGEGEVMAVLPEPLAAGESGCFTLALRDPLGAIEHFGSIELSTGADACASDDDIGAFEYGPIASDAQWNDELCVTAGERVTRVSMSAVIDVFGQAFELVLQLCDVCPQ